MEVGNSRGQHYVKNYLRGSVISGIREKRRGLCDILRRIWTRKRFAIRSEIPHITIHLQQFQEHAR